MRLLKLLDTGLSRLTGLAAWLGLAVAALLFAQWPLRALLGDVSRQANDLGQWLFALFLAAAFTAATRAGAHLSADSLARAYTVRTRAYLARAALLIAVLPWALFLIYAGAPIAWRSLAQLERFQDTLDPGYFMIKLAALALPLLAALDALIVLAGLRRDGPAP